MASVALALLAAAGAWTWARAGAEEGLGAARSAGARAAAAEAALEDLTTEVEALERRMAVLTKDNDRFVTRMGRVRESLWGSLQRLRADLAAARSGSREALAGAGAAADEARSAARQLSVLEDRFEYHLRADHGGG